jgi:competence protein ComEA
MRGALLLTLAALMATAVASGVAAAPPKADPAAPEVNVDLNTASVAELEAVRGIGPALAKRIVAFRDEHGPFERVEDLLKVRGIGEKSLEKLRPYVRVGKRG